MGTRVRADVTVIRTIRQQHFPAAERGLRADQPNAQTRKHVTTDAQEFARR